MTGYLESLARRGAGAGADRVTARPASSPSSAAGSAQDAFDFVDIERESEESSSDEPTPEDPTFLPVGAADGAGVKQSAPSAQRREPVDPVHTQARTAIEPGDGSGRVPLERPGEPRRIVRSDSDAIPATTSTKGPRVAVADPEVPLGNEHSLPTRFDYEVPTALAAPHVPSGAEDHPTRSRALDGERQGTLVSGEQLTLPPELTQSKTAREFLRQEFAQPKLSQRERAHRELVRQEFAYHELAQEDSTRREPIPIPRELAALVDRLEMLIDQLERDQNVMHAPQQFTVPVARPPLRGFGDMVTQRSHVDRKWY